MSSETQPLDAPITGCVELLGADRVSGWVRRGPDGTFPLVHIHLHGRLVRSLRVRRELDDGRGRFEIGLAGSLLRYVPGPQALELRADGVVLPVLETTLPLRPGALGAAELDARLAEGHFVTKFGGLRLPLDQDLDWQERTFAHYERARSLLRELFDYDLHIAYGTLLGATREGGFISSDDDFDTTYHSRQSSTRAVRDELFDIATTLAARGEDVQLSGRKFVHWYSDRGAKLDVFPAWSRGENYFQAHVVGGPFAAVFASGYHEIELKGRSVSAPVDAEGALAATYGPGWRIPDPLFQWRVQPGARRAMKAVRVSPGQLSLVQWERHFAGTPATSTAPATPTAPADAVQEAGASDGPSEFARFVARRLGRRIVAVVDLGCGDGRDSLALAAGRPLLGVDGSRAAVAAARARASGESVRFERADVGDPRALRAVLAPTTARGPVAVCARRLLECVEEQSEAAALRVLRKLLAPGSLVLLELEVREEPSGPLGTPLLRHVEPSALARRWTAGSHFALESLEHDVADAVARVTLRKRGARERRWCERGLRLRRAAGRLRRRLSRGSPR